MTATYSRRHFLRAAGLTAGVVAGATRLASGVAWAGTSPRSEATSFKLTPDQVIADMRRAADYWMSQPPAYNDDNDWPNATYHSGNMALYNLVRDQKYLTYTLDWATANDFGLMQDSSSQPYDADHECAGQAYLDLYRLSGRSSDIAAVITRLDDQIATGSSEYWTWVDALHMAMPVFARLGVVRHDDSYLSAMHAMYTYTRDQLGGAGLLDPATRLWWRDATFVGTDTYWSRGNGWAIAAQAKVLQALGPGSPYYQEYAADLVSLAGALSAVQREDGFWNASLTQPTVDAGPETSGTAMHTYGIAWGVNHGLLDPARFAPVAERGWTALTSVALQPNGLLGYVQGTGSKPSDHYPWTATDTAPYGVGAFLLAGTQVAALAARHG